MASTGKMSARGWAAILISLIMIGIAYCFWLLSGPDPADRFEVLRVVTDPQTQRHAVVYRYDHSNSSTKSIAVWIVSGQPPSIGSKDPVRGALALVWPGSVDTLKLKWPRLDGRLLAEVDGVADIRKSEQFNDCYFDYDRKRLLFASTQNKLTCVQPPIDS